MNQRILVIACAIAVLPSLALATNPPAHDLDVRVDVDQNQVATAENGDIAIKSTYNERRQAPAVNGTPIYASGPCAYGASFGVSTPLGGATGGKTKPDENCDRRELVRVVTPLNPYLALAIACTDPIVVAMIADKLVGDDQCKYVPPAPPKPTAGEAGPSAQAQAAPVADLYVTREEFERRMRVEAGK